MKGLHSRHVSDLEDIIKTKAIEIIDRMVAANPDGTTDFVEQFAVFLEIICSMMGIPESDYARFEWTNTILGASDPEFGGTQNDSWRLPRDLCVCPRTRERSRANPSDDITSALMAAEVDGDRLSPQEFGSSSFFLSLPATKRQGTLTHGRTL